MAREARKDHPGAIQHVMARGIEKRNIFLDEKDRNYFLKIVARVIQKPGSGECYAWALMSNHIHLLIHVGEKPLGQMMKSILTGYAVYFNKRYQRSGHLFANRYKSELCQNEKHFLELIRYIHLNPLRAGLVKSESELSKYLWTGHNALLEKRKNKWQNTEDIIKLFGNKDRRKKYRQFIEEGIKEDYHKSGLIESISEEMEEKNEKGDYYSRFIGQKEFVQKAVKKQMERIKSYKNPRPLDEIIDEICDKHKVSKEKIRSNSKNRELVKVRREICYFAIKKHHYKNRYIAQQLGLHESAVSHALRVYGQQTFKGRT